MTYWERLAKMKLNSHQRRIERYRIICVWKSLENIVPDTNITLANDVSSRIGRMCRLPALKPKERKKRGPKLFNCLPKSIRNLRGIGVEEFKEHLFLPNVHFQPPWELFGVRWFQTISLV